jgi:hypothetical protein
MPRLRIAFLMLSCAAIAFLLVGYGTYALLWHYSGMTHVSSEDNPAVVLGTFWCLGWGFVAGILSGVLAAVAARAPIS